MRIFATVMMVVLGLLAVASALLGYGMAFVAAKETGSAIHEIEGLICFVVTAVALAGVGVIAALKSR